MPVKPYSGVLMAQQDPEQEALNMAMTSEPPPSEEPALPPALVEAAKPAEQKLREQLEKQRMQQELIKRAQEATALQRQGVAENEAQLAKIQGQPEQFNWAPVAAVADFVSDSNKYSKMAPQVQSPGEREKEIFMLKNYLQQQKKALSDDEISLLKSQLADRQLGIQERADRKFGKDIDDKIREGFKPTTKDLEDLGAKYKDLEGALASGSSVKVNAALSNFARLIAGEKGVLTDQDIVRAMPATAVQRFNTLATYFSDKTKPPPPGVVNEMIDLVQQSKKHLREGYMNKLERAKGEFDALPAYQGAPAIDNLYKKNSEMVFKNLPDSAVKKYKVGGQKPDKQKDAVDLEIEKLTKELGM